MPSQALASGQLPINQPSPAKPARRGRSGAAGRGVARDFPRDFARDFDREVLPQLDRVHALARGLARPPLDADELTQETFARAYAAYHRFAPGSDVRAWLTTILLNLVRGEVRRRRVEQVLLTEEVTPAVQNCEVVALRNLDRQSVLEAVHRLPEEFRVAICVVDLAGLSVKEAAAVLDIPRGTVCSRLSRGRARLGRMLAPALDPRESAT
jgi:RNA polymerase sigma-70 factor, ECF subfamily